METLYSVLSYLGRYTTRVAISNARPLKLDGEIVTYRLKDYRDGDRWKVSGIEGVEFLRRLAQHILSRGFVRIRDYGLLSSRKRKECLTRRRELLGVAVEIVEKIPPRTLNPPGNAPNATRALWCEPVVSQESQRPDFTGVERHRDGRSLPGTDLPVAVTGRDAPKGPRAVY